VLRVFAAIAHSAAALFVGLGRLGIATTALAVFAAVGAFFAAAFLAVTGAHLAIAAALSVLAAVHGFAFGLHLFAARTCGFRVAGWRLGGCGLGDHCDRYDQHQYEYEDFRFHNFLSIWWFRLAALHAAVLDSGFYGNGDTRRLERSTSASLFSAGSPGARTAIHPATERVRPAASRSAHWTAHWMSGTGHAVSCARGPAGYS